MAHDVFISYSSKDKVVADAVCATLESRKIRCWIAPRDVLASTSWGESIIEAIGKSHLVVLVFSANSNSAQQVMKEVDRAVDKGIPILPFRIQDVTPDKSMELYLAGTHWLDALTPPLEQHLQRLADTVQSILGTRAEKSAEETTTPKAVPMATGRKYIKPLYLISGVAVIALIILGILFMTGSFGDRNPNRNIPPTNVSSGQLSTSTDSLSSPTLVPGDKTTTTPLPSSTGTTSPINTDPKTTLPANTATSTPFTGGVTPSGDLTSGTSLQSQLKPGETQWYYFNAEAGDAVYAVLSKGTNDSQMRPWLELLGPDGNAIYGNFGGTSVSIDRGITKSGKYTLRVRDYANLGGNYVLAFMQISKSVNPLTSGASIQGRLKFPGEVNWSTFDAQAGDAVYAVLSKGTNDSQMRPWLELLGPDGNAIYGNFGGTSVNIDRGITKSGKYTLRVRDYANLGGNYVLAFMQISKSVNPLTSGASIQGQLKFPGEVNWSTFDAQAGDAVYAVLSKGTNDSQMRPWLELLGPDGNAIYGNFGGTSVNIDRGITKSGKHTLRVRDYANIGGAYVLSFNMTKKP